MEEVQFTGALERLRLRLLDNLATIQHGTDPTEARIEATRTQPEQRAMPLRPGDTVVLGARRLHVLPTPLSSFVVHADDDEAARTLQMDPVLATLAARMKTRVATRTGKNEPVQQTASPGVAVLAAAGADTPARVGQRLRAGANEVLLLTGRAELPRQICIYWMDETARGATLAVAASLLRHLPAEAICVSVAPAARRDSRRASALRALLDARSEARAAHALETRTELLVGEMPQALKEYIASLDQPLLVLGSSHSPQAIELLEGILRKLPDVPVLLVYREAA